ncbi:MAG: hypothetical protein KHZ87_05580 [Clostridiales bacterium]|nr:hypothetical protein [Clostridiales bacterium]MBS5877281.1 hypothetical protein [Clostridiales bacterium]
MKKTILTAAIVGMAAIGLVGCGNKAEPPKSNEISTSESKESFNVQKIEIKKGDSVVSKQLIVKALSTEVNNDYVVKWYNEVVKANEGYNNYFIVFTDKHDKEGVSSMCDLIETPVNLEQEKDGSYYFGKSREDTKQYTCNGTELKDI